MFFLCRHRYVVRLSFERVGPIILQETPKSAVTRSLFSAIVVSRVWVASSRYDMIGHNIPFITTKILYFATMMARVYSMKAVSTSDGRYMEVCFPYLKKKRCNRGGKIITLMVFYRGSKRHKIVSFYLF